MTSRSESGAEDVRSFSTTALEINSSSSNPSKPAPSSSALKCDRLLASLQDCVKKHPAQQDTVCAHLHRAAGWCLIRIACPVQVEDLEDCVGAVPSKKMPLGPPLVPERCRQQALKLEICLAAHQIDPRDT